MRDCVLRRQPMKIPDSILPIPPVRKLAQTVDIEAFRERVLLRANEFGNESRSGYSRRKRTHKRLRGRSYLHLSFLIERSARGANRLKRGEASHVVLNSSH